MAGETIKSEAICLGIRPWSRTSHIVRWLVPDGPVTTLVKGAVRPKSAFLGQYDANYTCEIVYYARERGELHALRECAPLALRENLREDYRALVLAEYMRSQVATLAPRGPEAREWFALLARALDELNGGRGASAAESVSRLLDFELAVLRLEGLFPEIEAASGAFALRGERVLPVSAAIVRCLHDVRAENNLKILLDTARAIGVFYTFHLDSAPEVRRSVLRMLSNNEEGTGKKDG